MSVIRVKISSPGNQTWSLLEPLFKQEYTSSGSRWTQEDQRGSKVSTSPEEEGGDLTWAMTWDRKWEKHTRMKSFQFCCGFRIIRPLSCVCVCVWFFTIKLDCIPSLSPLAAAVNQILEDTAPPGDGLVSVPVAGIVCLWILYIHSYNRLQWRLMKQW